jgi:hypothetical protein
MNYLSLLFVLLYFLSSCAGNEISPPSASLHSEKPLAPIVKIDSYKDLEHASKKYSQPVVWVRIASLEDRYLLENSVLEGFRSHGIDPIPGVDVFPPGIKITRKMVIPSFQQSAGDSLLIISLKPDSTLYHMAYDATLYDDKLNKVWIGHVLTDLQQIDPTNIQIDELMFQATALGIVNKIIKDGVILKVVN